MTQTFVSVIALVDAGTIECAHTVITIASALLIGINYFRQRGELKGCINDVRRVKQFLETYFRFRAEDMVILTDDQQDPRFRPTRANIIAAMHWLVNDARVNDSYFFHYSGHGGQMQDKDGDEADGYDETILPVDYEQAGQIVDDEMHAIMVRPLPPGVRLTALFDSWYFRYFVSFLIRIYLVTAAQHWTCLMCTTAKGS